MEKIVIMVLIILTMGQAKEDLEIMKEMMAEMKERLSLAEGKLAKTEGQLSVTKDELAFTKNVMAKAISEQAEAITCLATKDELTATKDALIYKSDELEREVAILRAPPFIHSCGSHDDYLSGSTGTIPYTSLLYSSTNTEGGGLDITTGIFTAPHGGSYTVYWDTSAYMVCKKWVSIYLQKNGESIQESQHVSDYNGPSGAVHDQGKLLLISLTITAYHIGGRTIVVYLAMGDTLQLYRDGGTGSIGHITFCVSLTTFDIV